MATHAQQMEELRIKQQHELEKLRIEENSKQAILRYGNWRTIIIGSIVVLVAIFGVFLPVLYSAGQETLIEIRQNWVDTKSIAVGVGVAFAGALSVIIVFQFRWKNSPALAVTNDKLQARIIELEEKLQNCLEQQQTTSQSEVS